MGLVDAETRRMRRMVQNKAYQHALAAAQGFPEPGERRLVRERFSVSWRHAMLRDDLECHRCLEPMKLTAYSTSENERLVRKSWTCFNCGDRAHGQYRRYVIPELPLTAQESRDAGLCSQN